MIAVRARIQSPHRVRCGTAARKAPNHDALASNRSVASNCTLAPSRHPTRKLTLILVFLLPAFALLAGCASDPAEGYSFKTTHREDVHTIAIPIFENTTYNRGVEFDLTDAIIKEVEARTPYKVTSPERADTVLTGRIRSVQLEQISKSPLTGLSEEMVVTVTIDFEWQDLLTGKPLMRRESFSGQGLFVPSRPTGELMELGRLAAVEQLAHDVVAEMRSTW